MSIKILIADDSCVTTQLLRAILEEEADIEVIGCAKDGVEAIALTKKLKPDLVTMDVFMPNIDGVEATKTIMKECPTPIIILSSYVNDRESKIVFNALQAGALSVMEKPKNVLGDGFIQIKRQLINSVRVLSKIRVVSRKIYDVSPPAMIPIKHKKSTEFSILALGSSTGGPGALNTILSPFPADFPLPIVITQHITDGFLPGLVSWLQQNSKLVIEIAKDNQALTPGHVYFANHGAHLLIKKGENAPVAVLDSSGPIEYFKPSITVLFSSLAKSYPNAAIGGLLTGMGKDGAEGLLQMKNSGCFTFAQSEATSIVYGMPAAAVLLNAVDQVLDLEKIPKVLATLIDKGE